MTRFRPIIRIIGNNRIIIVLPEKKVDEIFLKGFKIELDNGPLRNRKRYTFSHRWALHVKFQTTEGKLVYDNIPWSVFDLLLIYFPVVIFKNRVLTNIV